MSQDKSPREWLYNAEFWVPENYMYKSGSDCLEVHPDAGPACGVVSTTAYDLLAEENKILKEAIDQAIHQAFEDDPCITEEYYNSHILVKALKRVEELK